jgi:hypothetical protein
MNDVRGMIYATLIGFFMVLVFWFGVIYLSSCGFTLTCNQADQIVVRTPIPTLIPPSSANPQGGENVPEFNKCQVAATELIGAWVSAEHPETEVFPFTDVNGQPCEGTYTEDIQSLFVENSLWYPGAIGCVSCHNADQTDRNAGLDLTSYEAISAGTNIFGGGDWETSILHEVLVNQKLVPEGHAKEEPGELIFVFAGHSIGEAEVTPTPTP